MFAEQHRNLLLLELLHHGLEGLGPQVVAAAHGVDKGQLLEPVGPRQAGEGAVPAGQGPGHGDGGKLLAVPAVELAEHGRHRPGPGGDAGAGSGFELLELLGHQLHHGAGLAGVVPNVGIPIAVIVEIGVGVASGVPFLLVVALAVLQHFEFGAPRDGPLGHRHRLALLGQGGGEAIPIDQHQLGLAEVAALLRCQPELVRVISRLQQAAHPQVVCG